ncbi:MAG: hypothetical protein ACK5NK_12525 [Niabella sp.]
MPKFLYSMFFCLVALAPSKIKRERSENGKAVRVFKKSGEKI